MITQCLCGPAPIFLFLTALFPSCHLDLTKKKSALAWKSKKPIKSIIWDRPVEKIFNVLIKKEDLQKERC